MTTTDQPSVRTTRRGRLLPSAGGLGLVTLALVVALAAVVPGVSDRSAAVLGALVGGALALAFFLVGATTVDTVARVLPSASLLVAMLTYTLQVLAMALVFLALTQSGALDSSLSRGWLSGSILAGTAAWVVAHLRVALTARIPAFDDAPPTSGRAPVRAEPASA